jgi:CCR4-NOT transcription complex subunit 1
MTFDDLPLSVLVVILVYFQLDGSLADLIMEIGYGFCSSVEECRNNLVNLGAREISPPAVARVLGMMVRSHTGLEEQVALQNIQTPASFWSSGGESSSKEKGATDTSHPTSWNVEIFVQTLKELVSCLYSKASFCNSTVAAKCCELQH